MRPPRWTRLGGRGRRSSSRGWEGDLQSGVRSAFHICLSPRRQWNHKPGQFPQETRIRPHELHFSNINRGRVLSEPCRLTRRAKQGSARRLCHTHPSCGLSPRLTRCAHWLYHPTGPSMGAFLLLTGCRIGVSCALSKSTSCNCDRGL